MVRVPFYRPALDSIRVPSFKCGGAYACPTLDSIRVPSFKCDGASAWDLFHQLDCGTPKRGPRRPRLGRRPAAEHEEVPAAADAAVREVAPAAHAAAPEQSHEEVPAPAGTEAEDPGPKEVPADAGATARRGDHRERPADADAPVSCGEAPAGAAAAAEGGQGQTLPASRAGTSPSVSGSRQAGRAGATQPRSRAEHDADLERALLESASEYAQQVSIDKARSERLQRTVDMYHARVKPVQADGNCQFRALSLQLYGDEGCHGDIRARVVRQLEAAPERYTGFVHEPYADYVKRLARHGEWGDNVTLQAACDVLDTDIRVLTDVEHAECIEVRPTHCSGDPGAPQKPPLCLAFLTEVHYDAAELLQ